MLHAIFEVLRGHMHTPFSVLLAIFTLFTLLNLFVPSSCVCFCSSYYTFLVVGYGFNVVYYDTGGANNTGPGALLAPGETFTSLSVRFVLHDASDQERQGLGVRCVKSAC
jgi:hypothetical protein